MPEFMNSTVSAPRDPLNPTILVEIPIALSSLVVYEPKKTKKQEEEESRRQPQTIYCNQHIKNVKEVLWL